MLRKSGSMSSVRSRNYRLLLYPDCPAHVAALDIIAHTCPEYAFVLHDRDVWAPADQDADGTHVAGQLKKPHWHVCLHYVHARYLSAVCEELGIEERHCIPDRNTEQGLRYLVHADDPDKYQYATADVVCSNPTLMDKALQGTSEEEQVLAILDLLDGIDTFVSTASFLRLVCAKGLYSHYRRCSYTFNQVLREHNASLVSAPPVVCKDFPSECRLMSHYDDIGGKL